MPLCGICQRQKRPGVLSCAVREAGITPAVRARIQTETSNAKRSKQAVRRLRLRKDSIPFAQWSFRTLGAGSELPFALTNSSRYRLRRFPHWGTASLVCHGLTGRVSESLPLRKQQKKAPHLGCLFCCRSGGLRTRGLLVPNQTRYQTALHLDIH